MSSCGKDAYSGGGLQRGSLQLTAFLPLGGMEAGPEEDLGDIVEAFNDGGDTGSDACEVVGDISALP